jgi:hypothetical protein
LPIAVLIRLASFMLRDSEFLHPPANVALAHVLPFLGDLPGKTMIGEAACRVWNKEMSPEARKLRPELNPDLIK